jgi:hypothetical protein
MFGPVASHIPCELDQQGRRRAARRASVARAVKSRRRRRAGDELQPVAADSLAGAFEGSEDVWRALRF